MTHTIEFDADILNGEVIQVPEIYKNELKDEDTVHVVLLHVERKKNSRYNVIRDMVDHPLVFSDGRIPSREEMHDGR